MTETWLGDEACVQVNGFKSFQLNRTVKKMNTKRNSGGLIAYVRYELVSDNTLFLMDSDDIIWLRLDSKHFDQDDDIFLCLCYNVPKGSSRQGLMDDADIFDRISDHVVHIQNTTHNKCKSLISGDFNARTATYADYVEDDSSEHVHVLPDDYQTDAPLHRMSEDKGFNHFGTKKLLDFCKLTGLRILNGRVGLDKNIGKCTYVGSTGKSFVDYIIASQSLFPAINTVRIDDPNILSDHCLIHFSLLLLAHDGATGQNVDAESGSSLDYKYIWDSTQAEAYQAALELEDIKVAFRNLQAGISSAETAEAINSNVCSFQRVMDSVCAPLFKRNVKHFSDEYTFNESKQPWFNDECREKRNVFYRCLDIFRSSKHDGNSRKIW